MPPVRTTSAGRRPAKPRPTCFVISPIGEDGSPERRRADQVLRHIIEPAASKAGYAKPQRADQIAAPGIITQQVIEAVADADLVIADLTEHNPNVFYELAIRHGLQSALVQVLESSQRLPFDIAQMRTIKFDIHDMDSVVRAREELVAQINELKNSETPMVTPVSVARDMKAMWESDDPTTHALADVLSAISSLKADVQSQRSSYLSFTPEPGLEERLKYRTIGSAFGEAPTINFPVSPAGSAAVRLGESFVFSHDIDQDSDVEPSSSRKPPSKRAQHRAPSKSSKPKPTGD